MSLEVPHVVDINKQQEIVGGVEDLSSYKELVGTFFPDSNQALWLRTVTEELSQPDLSDMPPEYFRFLGLVGIVFAQYGFPSLIAHVARHERNGWKKSPLDPKHLTAVAAYGGNINMQAIRLKERLSRQLETENLDAATGVWGLYFPVSKGRIIRGRQINLSAIEKAASSRITADRPICLPDKSMNKKLSALNFNGNDADSMPDDQFEIEVLPKAQKAVSGYVDLNPIFRR